MHQHIGQIQQNPFATFLALPKPEIRSLYLAGIVHDIGKVGIRDDVLLKPETLNPDEREMIMQHPKIAERILAPIGFQQVVRYVAVHHENVDGSGYPEGLRGEEIPLPGRILAIADTYDALCTERPYKTSLGGDEVRRMMQGLSGTKLDADLLGKFWTFIEGWSQAERSKALTAPREPSEDHGASDFA